MATGNRGAATLSLYLMHYPCNWQRRAQKNDTFFFYYGFSTYTSQTLEEQWYQGKVMNLLACSYGWWVEVRGQSARAETPGKTQVLEPEGQGVGRSCQAPLDWGSREIGWSSLPLGQSAPPTPPQVRFWAARDADGGVVAEMVCLYHLQLQVFLLVGKT